MTVAGSTLLGTPVVPGVAYAPALVVSRQISPDAVSAFEKSHTFDAETALEAYDDAVTRTAEGLESRAESCSGAAAEVLTATAGLVRDRGLRTTVRKGLEAGEPVLAAWHEAVEHFAGLLTNTGGMMAERVADLRDIELRVTARLVGEPEPGIPTPSEPSVLVAEDLAPSETAGLDTHKVAALVTQGGGATSHTAIIARQLGIPCVVGVRGLMEIADGTALLVDGLTGEVEVDPDASKAEQRVAEDKVRLEELEQWTGPGRTSDGTSIPLLANVADAESAIAAAKGPVEGVGLFRTELCFLDRADEPSVEEQTDLYAEVLGAFGGDQHVVVRTLDAGSDKPLAFVGAADEDNPALGVRGLRLATADPELLERQLAGIAAAAERSGVETWVMAPMVATVEEAEGFAGQVRAHGLKAGVMVEVPSAALLADRMLEVVDFMSIGTNDLSQYTMAADRLASDLAHLTDAWQPAVLKLIALTAEAGQRAGKPVGVCGEAAADPLLATVLVGLGVTSLSMALAAVRPVGAQLAAVSLDTCRRAAEAALEAADPRASREAVRSALEAGAPHTV